MKDIQKDIQHDASIVHKVHDQMIKDIHRLQSENARLREALKVAHASLCTYGKHPLIDKQVSKALKGDDTCKP